MNFDANPFGVTAVAPVAPKPPVKEDEESADINVSDAAVDDMQTGVKQPEPPAPKKHPKTRW
eukprot:2625453-Heterocapsa_arctica.AAC.1